MTSIKLKPDRTLINSEFDGYKLSNCSDVVASYSKNIPDGLYCVPKSTSNESSSYLHTRTVSLHNYLVSEPPTDPSDAYSFYCFNSRGQLQAFDYCQELLCDSRVVWQIELCNTNPVQHPALLLENNRQEEKESEDEADRSVFGPLPPSLVFADHTTAVASDGRDKMFVIHTADRNPQQHHTWLTAFSASIGSSQIIDARIIASECETNPTSTLHILALSTTAPSSLPFKVQDHLKSASSLHIIHWITLTVDDGNVYKPSRERYYASTSPLQYCHFDVGCKSIVLLTHQHCHLLHDSQRPNLWEQLNKQQSDETKVKPRYVYFQSHGGITVKVSMGTSTSIHNLKIFITSTEVVVKDCRNSSDVFRATFLYEVDYETSCWVMEGGTFEVRVDKAEAGVEWPAIFKERDLKGEEVLGDDELRAMRDKLSHLTTDDWGKGGMGDKPAYNPNQLEACDDADSDLLLLTVDGEGDCTVKDTPRAMLGNTQYLATIKSNSGDPALFCLRHDVDGLVYKVEGTFATASEQFKHTATFDAFGYVKASKTMAKYTSAPEDGSYVAVCDTTSHVYVFCQPMATSGRELKNRKTGKVIKKVARQLLLSVPCHDEVLGFVTINNIIVACTKDKLFTYVLSLDDA